MTLFRGRAVTKWFNEMELGNEDIFRVEYIQCDWPATFDDPGATEISEETTFLNGDIVDELPDEVSYETYIKLINDAEQDTSYDLD